MRFNLRNQGDLFVNCLDIYNSPETERQVWIKIVVTHNDYENCFVNTLL